MRDGSGSAFRQTAVFKSTKKEFRSTALELKEGKRKKGNIRSEREKGERKWRESEWREGEGEMREGRER